MADDFLANKLLLIHKPVGPTSHDMVARVRRLTGEKRVGHAGTLDPFAEGLLIVLVGREMTKRQQEFLTMDKTYEATLHIGASSTTDDITGEITSFSSPPMPAENELATVLETFTGPISQIPPPFSAKKIKGVPAYKLARKGVIPELKPKMITVYEAALLSYAYPLLTVRFTVSSGTYIRALARDIGKSLGSGAYLEKLVRTAIGPYSLADAILLPQSENPRIR